MSDFVDIREFEKVKKTLYLLPEKFFTPSAREKVLASGAKPIQSAIRARTPVGKAAKHSTKDGIKKRGTLQRSVQVFKSRKDKEGWAVLVGNVLDKRSRISSVKGAAKLSKAKNKRAYYANIVLAIKKGSFNPGGGKTSITAFNFIEQGFAAAKGAAAINIKKAGEAVIKSFKQKYSF